MQARGSSRVAIALIALALFSAVLATDSVGAQSGKTGKPVSASGRATVAKGDVARLAKSDAALLASSSSKVVSVVVKLDYDSAAAYRGGVSSAPAATSPEVTGGSLDGSSDAERKYDSYQASKEKAFSDALAQKVSSAKIGRSLRAVYGGVSVVLPENRAKDLLSIAGVIAVQKDELRQPLTDSSTTFIGAPTIWSQVGGQALAGAGVRFASIDTGIWPEHPSFAANPSLPPRPTQKNGKPITCNFGDNPLTPASDVFVCNNKLIGGQPFLATYNSLNSDELYPTSARDSDGHGTHTSSTAAGDQVSPAPIFGIDRGPISGVAPGAQVLGYKVCGPLGCYDSDSALAIGQAIRDGANVINYSISGGTNPSTDPVELAFLDAYKARVFVAASAGNDGPTAGTANHLSGWVTSVAASTQTRDFETTITVASGGLSATFKGASITRGVSIPKVVVLAKDRGDEYCAGPFPAGTFTNKIVACRRGNGIARVDKGKTVLDAGAAGMILYNLPLQDTESDNHWLPAVHLADGTAFLAFVAAHPNAKAAWPDGVKGTDQGDVMASFSSRGPAGQLIKPDITAPGVQILAGNTPVRTDTSQGPPNEYFQAIAGTSMSSPHIAGSAILEKALHPTWTPGQIKSALMTTATQNVVKEDHTTPADPFDMGSGRVNLNTAGSPGLTLDETGQRYALLSADPINAMNLNLPSINAPTMPGSVTVTRTVLNVSGSQRTWNVTIAQPVAGTISVSPSSFNLQAGKSQVLTITISAPTARVGQYFGQINLVPSAGNTLHFPVAFNRTPGDVTLTQSCAPSNISIGNNSTCTVKATNKSFTDTTADITTNVGSRLSLVSANGATVTGPNTAALTGAPLSGEKAGIPSVALGSDAFGGYLNMVDFGITPEPLGDETLLNFDLPPFKYTGRTYTSIGVTSNGYAVAGGGDATDIDFQPQTLPDPAKPNDVMAPFWTDLNGTGASGLYSAIVTDGVNNWYVADWHVFIFGTTTEVRFELIVGLNGVEDVSFAYDPTALVAPPNANGLTVGAENITGTGGGQLSLAPGTVPSGSVRVTSSPGAPGGTAQYTVTVQGTSQGPGVVTSSMTSPIVPGTTYASNTIRVS